MGEDIEGFRQFDTTGSWRLTKYTFLSLTLQGLATVLAWTGMVTSIIFTILSTDILFVPLAVYCHRYYFHTLCGILYGTGVPGLLISVGFFIFSYKFWMKIKTNDINGMKAFVKIGCYIIASLEMTLCIALLLILPLYLLVDHIIVITIWGYPVSQVHVGVCILVIIVGIACVAFTSVMVHGLRNFNLRYVNIYILFRFVFLGLFLLITVALVLCGAFLVTRGVVALILTKINVFFIISFLYAFSMAFPVLQYNIMLSG